MEYRESNLALCHPLLSVAPEREGYFREQQTVNLLCWHAGLPENIYPGKFCGGDILSACTLLLVWIYFLKKKKKSQTNKKLQLFFCFSVSLPCFCTYSGKEQYIEVIVSFFTNCGFLTSKVPKLLRAQSFLLQ